MLKIDFYDKDFKKKTIEIPFHERKMRLTKKKYYRTCCRYYRVNKDVSISDLTFRLGKLEDIEEQIGLSLITVFNCLDRNMSVRFPDGSKVDNTIIGARYITKKQLVLIDNFSGEQLYLNFADYGKDTEDGWILSRE